MDNRLLPRDSSGHIIHAGSNIFVFSVFAPASDWTEIKLAENVDSKSIILQTRKRVRFKLSHKPNGEYITINKSVILDIVAKPGDTICYVQPKIDTEIEVLVLT